MEFADRIKQILNVLGKTRYTLAKECHIDQSTLSDYVNNGTIPSNKAMLSILRTYPQISAEWFMRGKGEILLKEDSLIDTLFDNPNPIDLFNHPDIIESGSVDRKELEHKHNQGDSLDLQLENSRLKGANEALAEENKRLMSIIELALRKSSN